MIWLFYIYDNFIFLFNSLTMINGVSLSSLRQVQQTHRAHFRRLKAIITQPATPQVDSEMVQVVRSRRHNHQKWKRFKQGKKTEQLQRENEFYRKKLQRIRMGSSIYRASNRGQFTNSVAHNFYNRKKLQLKIQVQNPEIARRLIEMQSSISTAKAKQEYGKMHQIMVRLEKFPVIDRLTSFSCHKNRHIKTQGNPPITTRNLSVPRRPPKNYF